MQITWHGQYTVKIVSKDITLVLDPYAPTVGLSPFRSKADIVALTNPADSSMSQVDAVQGEPVLINTPGEFSVKGFTLHAMSWQADDGNERSVHRWIIEDMTILHLGALQRELTSEELQELERANIDIVLLPVGGGSGLTTKQALKMVSTLEPRIVLPIHYKLPKLKESLDDVEQFAKEMGVNPKQKEKKFLVRASKLPQDDVQTIILAP